MSILDRLNLLVRANLNESLTTERSSSQRALFSDMESSIRDARRELAQVRAGERQLAQLMRQERERADQWEERAMLALRHGDDDLAREALRVKNTAMRELERLRDQLDGHRAHMRDIERALEALEMKLEGARGRLQARQPDAHASTPPSSVRDERDWDAELRRRMQQREQTSPSSSSSSSASTSAPSSSTRGHDGWASPPPKTSRERDVFDVSETSQHFDRMSQRISQMEAKIDAVRELSDDELMDPRKVELERIFGEMEDKKRAADDLSDLKKRFE